MTQQKQQWLGRGTQNLTNAQLWHAVEASTDVPVGEWLNTAHECCDRWADDPHRVAIVFRTASGARDV